MTRPWPHGDQKIPGLTGGMVEAAVKLFQGHAINPALLPTQVTAQIGKAGISLQTLNYMAGRLMQVWPLRFATMAST